MVGHSLYSKNLIPFLRDTGPAKAEENMAQDAALLEGLDPNGAPILHLYDWEAPSATFGYFLDIKKYLNLDGIARRGVQLARRPTGGGIVFHIWDLAFSLLLPAGHPKFSVNTLDNYGLVNQVVLDAIVSCFSLDNVSLIQEPGALMGPSCNHFCMARPTVYDAVFRGMKVAGAAQRRTRKGFLHQGTISLCWPDTDLLQDVLLSQEEVVRAMETYTFAPLGKVDSPEILREARNELKGVLCQKFIAELQT